MRLGDCGIRQASAHDLGGRCYDGRRQAMSSTRRHFSPCLEEGCGKNMLDVCYDPTSYDEYIATVQRGNECQPRA